LERQVKAIMKAIESLHKTDMEIVTRFCKNLLDSIIKLDNEQDTIKKYLFSKELKEKTKGQDREKKETIKKESKNIEDYPMYT